MVINIIARNLLFSSRTPCTVNRIAVGTPRLACYLQRILVDRHARASVQGSPAYNLNHRRMVQGVPIENGFLVNHNPATGEVIGKIRCTTATELDEMVQQANDARQSWKDTSSKERIALLRKGLESLAQKKDELAKLMTSEMGKPISEAREEADFAVDKSEFLDILTKSLEDRRHGSSVVVRHPLGVVAILSPWNFPADEILLLLLPALGSGNTAIVKPSEVSPRTGEAVVSALQEVLPAGVLHLAQGDGAVGQHLVKHPDVHFVAMTGSSATGRRIMEMAAPTAKKLVLEMGGKDPMIVFKDSDLEAAARDAVAYSLSNSGQVCCSIERIFVDEAVYDDFSKRVVTEAKEYKVGNGMNEDVKVGPLVSQMQCERVRSHVEDAVSKGAAKLWQGSAPDVSKCFHPVTVLGGVTEGMNMYKEETFGPVVALTPFDGSEKSAIKLANDTEYGLASSVYTADMEKATRVANAIDAGQVGINCYSLEHMNTACPWVGHKNSGFGYHSGQEGFHQFSIPKTLVYVPKES